MSPYDDPLRNYFKQAETDAEIGGEESTWNLLVQILLPLVLILTFVVVTEILGYKKAYKDMHGVVSTYLADKTNPDNLTARQNAIIDAQLQRLLLALERIKSEAEKRLNLGMFPGPEHIQRDGISLSDESFRFLCSETRGIFRSPFSLRSYENDVYRELLEEAGIVDNARIAVQRWKIEEEEMSESEKFKRKHAARRNVIYYKNRKIIHNHIIDFCEGLREEIVNLQESLIKLLFKELIDNPEDLDEEASTLVMRLIEPTIGEEERRRIANEFYRSIINKWQGKIDRKGYTFLEESWQKLKALD